MLRQQTQGRHRSLLAHRDQGINDPLDGLVALFRQGARVLDQRAGIPLALGDHLFDRLDGHQLGIIQRRDQIGIGLLAEKTLQDEHGGYTPTIWPIRVGGCPV